LTDKIKLLFKSNLIVFFNLYYYLTDLKERLMIIYLKVYEKIILKFFDVQKEKNNFLDLNKDYYLVFDYSCTTFPFYLFVFSLIILKYNINLKTIFFIFFITEIINFFRITALFFVYDKLNFSYEQFWLFHLFLSVFSLFLIFLFIWKLKDYILSNSS